MNKEPWHERLWHPERFYPKDGPVTDFGYGPIQRAYNWKQGLLDFYAMNHALIEDYPEECQIVKNAKLLEQMILDVFGEVIADFLQGAQ